MHLILRPSFYNNSAGKIYHLESRIAAIMTAQDVGNDEYIQTLVNDALDDIETSRLPISSIIKKCIRIARLRNDNRNLIWLELEMFNSSDSKLISDAIKGPISCLSKEQVDSFMKRFMELRTEERRYIRLTEDNKVIDKGKMLQNSVAEIERMQIKMRQFLAKIDNNTDYEAKNILEKFAENYEEILEKIAHRVHNFLGETEKQLLLYQLNMGIFERNNQFVDLKLGEICPEALSQFSSVYRRLQEKDPESYAQAATSCRRIIKSLADALYPPSDEPIRCNDGKDRILNDDKYKNRLIQYIQEQSANSASRKLLLADIELLINKIEKLYDLTCKGPHAEISEFEINQCVIQTYLLTGDILRISENESAIVIEDSNSESP